jgi:hypothetical protein
VVGSTQQLQHVPLMAGLSGPGKEVYAFRGIFREQAYQHYAETSEIALTCRKYCFDPTQALLEG